MKTTHDFEHCYRVLQLEVGCNKDELRKAYKQLIHKWHPDRYPDASKEKVIADDKIKAINIAYDQLNKFYLKTGYLPKAQDFLTSQQKHTAPDNRHNNVPANESTGSRRDFNVKPSANTKKASSKNTRHRSQPSARPFRVIIAGTIVAIMLPVMYYSLEKSEEADFNDSQIDKTNDLLIKQSSDEFDSTTSISNIDSNTAIHAEKQLDESVNSDLAPAEQANADDLEYFTQGSTLGEVLSVQGPPSDTDGNIWFYGRSEVHFENGKVSHWIRSANYPLRVQLDFKRSDATYLNKSAQP